MPIASIELVEKILAGETHSIARLISRAEAGSQECREAMAKLYKHSGKTHIIGVTGVPGSGKSTLMKSLAEGFRHEGHKVGIIAVDPSSPFSGGAILGDRIRMNELTADTGIFIRSMATRGALGGLARATLDAVDVLDAAGFDVVFIETVGVGQDEVDIVQAAHTTMVVSAPGLGDEIQAIKAGVLEIADIHTVSKCDRADANKTITDLKQMLMLGLEHSEPKKWPVPVIGSSAHTGEGVDTLIKTINQHYQYLNDSGEIAAKCETIARNRIIKYTENILYKQFTERCNELFQEVITRVTNREEDPHSAAETLLTTFK